MMHLLSIWPVHFIPYYDSNNLKLKLNMMLIQLEQAVDRVMVPLNRAHQCNHTCLDGEALIRFIVMPLAGASNQGRLSARATLAR